MLVYVSKARMCGIQHPAGSRPRSLRGAEARSLRASLPGGSLEHPGNPPATAPQEALG